MSTTDNALAIIDAKLGQTEERKFASMFPSVFVDGPKVFAAEKHYFCQLVSRSDQLQKAVQESPASVATAILDLAGMRLSLSPTLGQAYLVPQRAKKDGPLEVQVIPSYKGLETAILRDKIATSIGTQLVYENDTFEYGTTLDGPVLNFRMAMGDRGKLIGGFCLIRLSNGDKHVEWMTEKELMACEEAALNKAGGKLPPSWRGGFRAEMQKKCIVRRAVKHIGLTNMPEKVLESIDRDVGVADVDMVDVVPLIGDAEIRAIREALPELESQEQDQWLMRKAQAMGFDSIRDVPADQTEKIKHDLRLRMDNLMAAKAKANKEPVGGQGEAPLPDSAQPAAFHDSPLPKAAPNPGDARRLRVKSK